MDKQVLTDIRDSIERIHNELIQQRIVMEHIWNEVRNQLQMTNAVSENFVPQYFSKTEQPALIPLSPVAQDIGEKK